MSATDELGTPPTTVSAGIEGLTGAGASPELLASRLSRREKLVGPIVGLACLVVVGVLLTSGSYLSTIFEDILIFSIAAMGIDFLGGYGGLISLGQAGFLGAGAYGFAIAEQHGFGPWPAVGISLAVVLGLSLVTGIVAVRVSGITFVIVTLAIGQIFWGLTYQWTSLTSGDNGITVFSLPSIGPWSLSSTMPLWITTLIVFVVIMGLLLLMVRSPFGLSLKGMRNNEPRLRALGYRTGHQRYVGWTISTFVAGLAGVLYVISNHLVSPANLTFSQDGFLVVMVVLGGLGTIWGPVLGALVVVMFQQEISTYVSRWETLMGVVFIAVVIFTPGGIAGLLRKGQSAAHRLLTRHEGSGPALAAAGVGAVPGSGLASHAHRGEGPEVAGTTPTSTVPSNDGASATDTDTDTNATNAGRSSQ